MQRAEIFALRLSIESPMRQMIVRNPRGSWNFTEWKLELPEPGRAFDRARQDGLPNVVDCRQAAWRGSAPLESGRGRRPVKQRHVPRVGDAAALIIDEAIIVRAPRRDQPTNRQGRDAPFACLKPGSGLGDVECLTAEQRLQRVADTEGQSSDGCDNPEPRVL